MRSSDKFLIGIVAGTLILVAVALVVAVRLPPVTYRPANTPEAAAFNYLLAIQRRDNQRAFDLLSRNLAGRPANADTLGLQARMWGYAPDESNSAFEIVSSDVQPEEATVSVRETSFRQGGLFGSGESSYVFQMHLRSEDGTWKLAYSDRYWAPCWEQSGGCRQPG